MSQQSFEVAFFTIGEFEGLSADDTTRTAHIDVPADCLPVAATLQSARQWLNEQHAHIDMECAAELPRSEERRVEKECRSRWSPYH